MTENLGAKAALIVFLTLLAVLFALPNEKRPFWQENMAKFKIHLGLDLLGGAEIRLQIPESEARRRNLSMRQALDESVEVIEKRIYDSGIVKDAEVRRQGEDRILIQLPGVTEAEMNELRSILTTLGSLEFRIVADQPLIDREEQSKQSQGPRYQPPKNMAWYPIKDHSKSEFGGKSETLILLPESEDDDWTGDKLDRIAIDYDNLTQVVLFSIKSDLKALFGSFTSRNIKKRMAIIYNGEVTSAPTIQGRIEGNGQITGLSPQEVTRLQKVLKSGSLKVKPKEIGSNFVGPSLGEYTIKNGQRAVILGFIVTIAFMAAYYWAAGLVACVALVLNLLYLYAALVVFGATLTLPGIAGIILTVGMAVDANIIIYERIREERAQGKTLLQAAETGYERALTAIVDANVTTIITAVILYYFGTGAVKGFAVTLLFGIILSLFTALFVTRTIFGIGIRAGIYRKLAMLNLVGTPSIPFIGLRRPAMAGSLLLILGGMFLFQRAGDEIYGIDLQGGALTEMALGRSVDAAEVRKRIPPAFRAEVQEIQQLGADEADAPKRRAVKKYAIRARNLDLGFFLANRKKLLQEVEGYLLRTRSKAWVEAHRKEYLGGRVHKSDAGETIAFGELYRFLVQIDKADQLGLLQPVAPGAVVNQVPLAGEQAKGAKGAAGGRLVRHLRESLAEVNEEKISPDYLRFVLQEHFEKELIPRGLGHRVPLTGEQPGFRIQLALDRPYREQEVRDAMKATGFRGSYNVRAGDKQDPSQDFELTVFTTSKDPRKDLNMLARVASEKADPKLLLSEPFPTSESIGKLVAKHQKRSAFYAVIWSLLAILVYITVRFQLIYGVAAIICLAHDVLFTLGAIALFGGTKLVAVEINLPILAAFLTIIGYSLNDTIVVFDRIRENLNKPGRQDYDATINDSINQTLSRTLLTSLTTLIAVTILFALNFRKGGVIEGFSFALIVGVVIGTYSSVFIATPILVEWHHRSQKRLAAQKEARKQKKKQQKA